jgi:hypothetical protein
MCTKPQLKLVSHKTLLTSRDFCLHYVTESDAICKQMWLLYVLNLNVNSLWSYGIIYITWRNPYLVICKNIRHFLIVQHGA